MSSKQNKTIFMSVLISIAIHSIVIAGLVGGVSLFNSFGTSTIGGSGVGVSDIKATPQFIEVASVTVEAAKRELPQNKESSLSIKKTLNEKIDEKNIEEETPNTSHASLVRELGITGSSTGDDSGQRGEATELSTYVREVKKLIGAQSYYPQSAKKRGIEGTVNVTFSVSSRGEVYDVNISKGSGFNLLDDNALSIVKSVSPLPIPPRDDLRLELPLVFSIKRVW